MRSNETPIPAEHIEVEVLNPEAIYQKTASRIAPSEPGNHPQPFLLYKNQDRRDDHLMKSILVGVVPYNDPAEYILSSGIRNSISLADYDVERSHRLIRNLAEKLKEFHFEIGEFTTDFPMHGTYDLKIINPNTRLEYTLRFHYGYDPYLDLRTTHSWNGDSAAFSRELKDYASTLAAVLEALYLQYDTPLPPPPLNTLILQTS